MKWLRHANSPWIAVSAGIALAVLFALFANQMSRSVETIAAVRTADSFLNILQQTQGYYSRNIAGPASGNGVSLRTDYAEHPNSIPYPATFMHGLARELSDRKADYDFRFYSPLPFVDRPDSGPQDEFEWEAWSLFSSDPDQDRLLQIDQNGGHAVVRYAIPVRMGDGCVACHNSHEMSPHTYWQTGDLRGVQAISMPLNTLHESEAAEAQRSMAGLTILILALIALVTTGWILLMRNNRQLLQARVNIEKMANTDLLTSLGNRQRLFNAIDQKIALKPQNDANANGDIAGNAFTILVLDVCKFKVINDVHGQPIGDRVLEDVASSLRDALPGNAMISRLGADEFAAMMPGHMTIAEMDQAYRRIVARYDAPLVIDDKKLYIQMNAGFAVYPNDGADRGGLLAAANLALQAAKQSRPGAWQHFRQAMREQAQHADELAQELKLAFERRELTLFFQPQFDFSTRSLTGFEALVRWQHPERGILPPGAFLPIAEQRSMMLDMGEHLAHELVNVMHRWHAAGVPKVKFALNLHDDQLKDRDHLDKIERIVEGSGWDPSLITFEITEGCALEPESQELDRLARWQNAGYGVALDDFGTGYASLVHLRDLPIDEIKIDRSFAIDIEQAAQTKAIVRALTDISQTMNLTIVAEGIETESQAKIFADFGCDVAQGFLFGKPMSEADAMELARVQKGKRRHYDSQTLAAVNERDTEAAETL